MAFNSPIRKCKVHIDSTIIDEVNDFKFLGVIIDNKLTWKMHITYICTKISQVIGVLAKIRYKISQAAAMLIYESLIAVHFCYCNIVWGAACTSFLEPLYILQKRALKIVLHLPRLTHSDDIFLKANKLSLHELFERNSLSFVYSIINHISTPVFDDFFVLTENVHSYATRSQGGLHTEFASKLVRKQSIKIRAPQLWASIPLSIRNSPSLSVFKKRLKIYYQSKR